MPGNSIDIIGIALKVNPMASINTKDGQQKDKLEITICDDSECAISVTLWGELCLIEVV